MTVAVIRTLVCLTDVLNACRRGWMIGMDTWKFPRGRAAFALLIVGLSSFGCSNDVYVHPGNVQTSTAAVDVGMATSVTASVDARTGADLIIHDDGNHLLAGDFTFNEMLKPVVSYSVDGTLGKLDITQPAQQNLDPRRLDNVWDLRFGSAIPVQLQTNVSSGNSKIDIATLRLASLDVDTSSGNLEANISGDQEVLKSVTAAASSGEMNLVQHGSFPVLETVRLTVASGNVHLAMDGDFKTLSDLQVKTISGNTTVDLSGSWSHDLNASITTTSGNVILNLPNDVGLRISASIASGNVIAHGFHRDGEAYVNDAYDTSTVTLRLDVHVTSGNVVLNLDD